MIRETDDDRLRTRSPNDDIRDFATRLANRGGRVLSQQTASYSARLPFTESGALRQCGGEIDRRALTSWKYVTWVGGPPLGGRIHGNTPSPKGTVAEVVNTDARRN